MNEADRARPRHLPVQREDEVTRTGITAWSDRETGAALRAPGADSSSTWRRREADGMLARAGLEGPWEWRRVRGRGGAGVRPTACREGVLHSSCFHSAARTSIMGVTWEAVRTANPWAPCRPSESGTWQPIHSSGACGHLTERELPLMPPMSSPSPHRHMARRPVLPGAGFGRTVPVSPH